MNIKRTAILTGGIVVIGLTVWGLSRGQVNKSDFGDVSSSTDPSMLLTKESTTTAQGLEYGYMPKASTTPAHETQPSTAIPQLDRAVVIPTSFSEKDAFSAKASIGNLIEALKKDPKNGALWAELGMKRKGIGDYVGAKEAYEYAFKLMPNNAVVADNLGVIYGDYLKDYPKAEKYYRLAITLEPVLGYHYLRLFEFYRYITKDSAKARALLEEGLRSIPGEPSFKALLEELNS